MSYPPSTLLRKLAWVIASIGLLIRLSIVFAKPEVLYIDDTFYSLGIARNIAQGVGWTHDGIHFTNGFQPLYVFLSVPLYWLLPSGMATVPVVSLVLQSLANMAAGLLLYALIEKEIGVFGAFVAILVWSVSPYIISGINGLETTYTVLLMVSLLYLYMGHWRAVLLNENSRRRWNYAVVLGVLSGLLVLSRVDAAVFVAMLFLDICAVCMIRNRRGASILGEGGMLLVMALATTLTVLPWVVGSWLEVGRVLFDSGNATRSAAMAFYDGANLYLDHLRALIPNFQARVITPFIPWARHVQRRYILITLVAAILFALWAIASHPATGARTKATLRRFTFVWLYAIALILAYVFYQFTVWNWPRYLYPLSVPGLLLMALWFQLMMEVLFESLSPAKRWIGQVTYAAICGVYLVLVPVSVVTGVNPILEDSAGWYTAAQYRAAIWLSENTGSEDRVAAFQSGILGYYSERQVINLDGVVNPAALPYYVDNRVADYLSQLHVDYVADWSDFITRHVDLSDTPGISAEVVAEIPGSNPVTIIRISRHE